MALRTRWVGIGTAALLGLVAVAVLPPRPCGVGGRSTVRMAYCPYGYETGVNQPAVAERTRDRLRQALERRRLADSLLGTNSARQLNSDSRVTVFYEAPLSADSARRWLTLAEREMAMFPGSDGGVRVVLVLQSDPARLVAGKPGGVRTATGRWWYRPQLDRFATSAGGGVCFVVADLWKGAQLDALLRQGRPRLLDWCALYGRFGTPGAGVADWAESAFSLGWRDRWSIAEMVAASRVQRTNTIALDYDDYRIRACQSGAGGSCLQYLGAAGPSGVPTWRLALRERARDLLVWLLATREPAQFARFWRAQGTVAQALAEGYDRPSGEVLQEWTRARFPVQPSVQMARPRVLLAGALWFCIAMVAAFVAMQRRQSD